MNKSAGIFGRMLNQRIWLAAVILLVLGLTPHDAAGQTSVYFEVSSFVFEPRSPYTAVIRWSTSAQSSVSSYRLYRTSSDAARNGWVSRYNIVAGEDGQQYTVVDAKIVPHETFRYFLYGYAQEQPGPDFYFVPLPAVYAVYALYLPALESSPSLRIAPCEISNCK